MSDQEATEHQQDRARSKKRHEDVLNVLQRLTTVTTLDGFLECVRIGAALAFDAQKQEIEERFGP